MEEYTLMLCQQDNIPSKPLSKWYPKYGYKTFYQDAFNAILKIGTQKKTTKKMHELFNVFMVPLYESYYH